MNVQSKFGYFMATYYCDLHVSRTALRKDRQTDERLDFYMPPADLQMYKYTAQYLRPWQTGILLYTDK